MPKVMENLTGQKFGRLFVVAYYGSRKWLCACACGEDSLPYAYDLKSGHTKSCGCLHKELLGARARTHGLSKKVPEYNSWKELKKRCSNPKQQDYHNYGGRGIKVCERWVNSFENFYADMGSKPSPAHSIDRINVDGNYEPSNCRWATAKEQRNNQRKKEMTNE